MKTKKKTKRTSNLLQHLNVYRNTLFYSVNYMYFTGPCFILTHYATENCLQLNSHYRIQNKRISLHNVKENANAMKMQKRKYIFN